MTPTLPVPRQAAPARPLVSSRWGALLVPSFTEIFLIALLAWLFAAGAYGWSGLLSDGDAGWHIRTGEWVLAHGTVPHADLFSFSKPGEPWYAWEWGADVIFALLHRSFGLRGLAFFAGLLIVGSAGLLLGQLVWRKVNFFVALPVVLLAVGASSIHFLARPHIFTLFFLPAALWLLAADREQPRRAVWLLVPLTAVWTNLHGGFLALIACVGLEAAGAALAWWELHRTARTESEEAAIEQDGLRKAAAHRALRMTGLALACAAATVLNPYGLALHGHIGTYLRSDFIRGAVQEFQSPSFRSESMLQFEALLLAGLLAVGLVLARPGRRPWAELLMTLFWAHAALGAVRHVTIFALVATPLVAVEASRLVGILLERARRGSIVRIILGDVASEVSQGFRRVSIWGPVLLVAIALNDPPKGEWPKDFPKEKFPVALIAQHEQRLVSGRVLTVDQWADYLIYRFYPRQRVFIDGRSDFFGPKIGGEYIRLMSGQRDWKSLITKWDFDTVLCPPEWALASLLRQDTEWRLEAETSDALLFFRVPKPTTGGGI
jgi:hypothetical protein